MNAAEGHYGVLPEPVLQLCLESNRQRETALLALKSKQQPAFFPDCEDDFYSSDLPIHPEDKFDIQLYVCGSSVVDQRLSAGSRQLPSFAETS